MNAPTQTIEQVPVHVSVMTPTAAALSRGAAAALDLVQGFEVTDAPTYDIAADELKAIKGRAAKLDEQRKSITKPMDDAKKAVMDLFREPIEVLTRAEGILKDKMLGYQQEQARIAAEARRKAEEDARKERERLAAEARAAEEAARVEREKAAAAAAAIAAAAAEAERARLAAEQEAAAAAAAMARTTNEAERARITAEQEAAAAAAAVAQAAYEAERTRLAAEQEAAASAAAHAEAQAQTQQFVASMVVAAPSAAPAAPVAKGISTRETIEHDVTDLLALVKHVAEHPELIGLLAVDTVKLRNYVKGLGLNTKLPGVRVYPKQSLAARRG